MEGRSDGAVAVAQFFVAVGPQLAGEARRAAAHVALAVTEPKTQEYLALNTESDVVVAERLVFSHAMQRQRKISHLLNVHTNRLLSIFLLLTVEALHLHAELIGKDSVEEDADESSESQTGEGYRTNLNATIRAILYADRHNHDERSYEHVARRREVDRCLDEVAHTYSRNHTIENEAHTADCSGWHQTDEAGKLRAEAEHDGEAGCKADDSRIEHLGEVEHTGVLAVCSVGRSAEHRGEKRSKSVAAECAMQARLLDEVLAHGALDGTHITDMLHDCGEGDRENGDYRCHDTGLITGQDLMKQLKGQPLGSRLLIPCNMLKMDEDIFLDDFTLKEVSDTLQVPIDIVKSSGQDLIDAILGVAGPNPTDIDENQMKDRRITTD